VVVTPCTSKIIKNSLSVFERGEDLLQNGSTLCLDSVNHQKSRWKVGKNLSRRKTDFSEMGLALKCHFVSVIN